MKKFFKSHNGWNSGLNKEQGYEVQKKIDRIIKGDLIVNLHSPFNFYIFWIESKIAEILNLNINLMLLNDVFTVRKIENYLNFNRWHIPDGVDRKIWKEFLKNEGRIKKLIDEERAVVMWVIDRLLKIKSEEEFGEKHYKIINLKIDSYEALQFNRDKLEGMYRDFENYKIPGYEIASKYIKQTGIGGVSELTNIFLEERYIGCNDERLFPNKLL